MPISDTAKSVLDFVKENGKVSGGTVKDCLSLKNSEFIEAKNELKTYGLVEVGRGRGGTITHVEGVPLPTEAPKRSRAEILADAREEKAEKKREQQKYKQRIDEAIKKATKSYPDNTIELDFYSPNEDIVWVRLWDKGHTKAKVIGYEL